MTATNTELMANSVSSTPGATEPANMNISVRARHIPPSAILKVLSLFILEPPDVKHQIALYTVAAAVGADVALERLAAHVVTSGRT